MRRALLIPAGVCALVLAICAPSRADELKLKDGTKISGTIVGFDDNSFKVKTAYGFAIIRRDEVVAIVIKETEKKAPAETKLSDKPAAPAPEKKAEAPAAETQPAAKSASPAASKPPEKPAPGPAAKNSPPPVSAGPTPAPTPEPVREEVNGNEYDNLTYGFRMYKPPAWQVLEGARDILPGAITAMGTSDERTYLLVGQGPAGKSLKADLAAAEQRLRDALDDFRPLEENQITVGGLPALEKKFHGAADEHDWSGVVVLVERNKQVYAIYGMTYADSDLVQIQENVIARVVNSLQFTQ